MAAVNFVAQLTALLLAFQVVTRLSEHVTFVEAHPKFAICTSFPPKLPSSTGFEALHRTHCHLKRSAILKSSQSMKLLALSLLLISGNIESNPGPTYKYPCGECSKPVKRNQPGVQCDTCDIWYHTRCMGISNKSYENLANLSTVWICSCCGVANFTQSLFIQDQLNETLNSFSSLTPTALSYLNSTSPLFGTSTQQSSSPPRKHRHTSSTPNPKPQCQRPRGRSSKLHCMEINCNSIMSSERAAIFSAHVNIHDPDVIFGCESKLDQSVPTQSCFPIGYTVYRKERLSPGGGGVFLMVRSSIPSSLVPFPSHSEDDESLWVRVHVGKTKSVYLCSYYKPPSAPVSRLASLSESLGDIFFANRKSHPSIVLAGDFNLGDIDWSVDPPCPTDSTSAADMEKFLDFIDDNALIQHVTDPTCPASLKTLD